MVAIVVSLGSRAVLEICISLFAHLHIRRWWQGQQVLEDVSSADLPSIRLLLLFTWCCRRKNALIRLCCFCTDGVEMPSFSFLLPSALWTKNELREKEKVVSTRGPFRRTTLTSVNLHYCSLSKTHWSSNRLSSPSALVNWFAGRGSSVWCRQIVQTLFVM